MPKDLIMKRFVLTAITGVAFFLFTDLGLAQEYDLIVTTKGDSIACQIDSITESSIYFRMKVKGDWTPTSISLDMVSLQQQNVIEKKQYIFDPGSSIIKSVYTGLLPRNSVYAGIGTVTYARTFLGNPYGITLAGGVLYIDAPGVLLESTFLVGGFRHWFEPGIMGYYLFNNATSTEENNSLAGISIRMGYRYQGPRGFLLRAAPLVTYLDKHIILLPGLSLGYSF